MPPHEGEAQICIMAAMKTLVRHSLITRHNQFCPCGAIITLQVCQRAIVAMSKLTAS
jgi:hypothetical protein